MVDWTDLKLNTLTKGKIALDGPKVKYLHCELMIGV